MQANTLIADLFDGLLRNLHAALDGVTPEQLTYRPAEHCNTLAWLVWHLTRVQDKRIGDLSGEAQVWVSQGWHARFGRKADPQDVGIGFKPEDVAGIRPESGQLLFDYYDAVRARSRAYLATLSPEDLDRQLDPNDPQITAGFRLRQCLLDNVAHAGQAAYLRGLIEGRMVYPS